VHSSTIKKQDFEKGKKTSRRKGGKSDLNAVKTDASCEAAVGRGYKNHL
jgi:hypothetical protein